MERAREPASCHAPRRRDTDADGTRTHSWNGAARHVLSCPVSYGRSGARAREVSSRSRPPSAMPRCCMLLSAIGTRSPAPAAEPLDGRTEWGQASASWSLRRPRGQPRTFVHKCRPGVPPGSDISLEACGKRRREKRRK